MSRSLAHVRSSRRIPPLIDSDIDHEIDLVNRAAVPETPRRSNATAADASAILTTSEQAPSPTDSRSPLTSGAAEEPTSPPFGDAAADIGPAGGQDTSGPSAGGGPSADDNGQRNSSPKPRGNKGKQPSPRRRRPLRKPETDIDVLYENERGCLFCGLPLFSSAALGNLDPSPWTNFAHKTSPTDTRSAQVPDPSWTWAWPDWRVNHDDAINIDKDGWEYSFMFAKKFSWHGPKWWNSFVRRRAWIRRRIKKVDVDLAGDPYIITAGYFEIRPAKKPYHGSLSRSSGMAERLSVGKRSERSRTPDVASQASSRERGRGGWMAADSAQKPPEPKTIESLMTTLRRARIDREKLEAVENYIEHCGDDLAGLQHFMHDVMAMFVFQTSRQLLISKLARLYDKLAAVAAEGEETPETGEKQRKKKGKGKGKGRKRSSSSGSREDYEKARRQRDNLAAAIIHADEEVRRLEYWSDIKSMAAKGESGGAVDPGRGWSAGWEGVDESGAKGPLKDHLP